LEREELNRLIEKIENENPKDKAFFGIHSMDEGDESYIKANKFGLELYAIELLKASSKINETFEFKDKEIISFDTKEKWITGNIWVGHIELKSEDRIDLKVETYKRSWKDKFMNIGCFIFIGLVIIIFIAGLFSVINWF
jgi:hypothetical protein